MKTTLAAALLLGATSAPAQHPHGHSAPPASGSPPAPSGYAGMQKRAIKALSEQQVEDVRAGKGMALALAAELNGYPGPLHVLELADRLALSQAQEHKTRQLAAAMQEEARAIGEQWLAAEAALDRLFRDRSAAPQTVEQAVQHAAQAHGRLRAAHLRYHLRMTEVLNVEQIAAYNRLRGYR
ncbi:MAG TPA: hypothetical protein VEC01_03500 [Noviherbaspirillum sp.]|uniref:hypothetical protein n=1 Tax=Noviherbaspirillum sp. TaxID=1926288 RepID=UPI002D3FEDCA|nr:hypothetical protein [Noviherbaspirillum sp.]HYD94367.1 hypothetical protein [Noviherbaspirillum sp.]